MSFLKRLLFGKPLVRINHPVLGEGVLMETRSGNYWEIERELLNQPFTLFIETVGEQPPTDQQVEFFLKFARNNDAAFATAAPLLVPEYERWVKGSFPAQWREAFQFVAMTVPLDADDKNDWDLSFECLQDKDRHNFCCRMQGGTAVEVQVDG
ncbi:hypothetical protein ACG04R_28235 [Roseateles sp. BYS78W]|uniref:Uncharacterized protein n=1 Tax=Pelomonas candidula TaxID=3299025 RepID=A0ABW7HL15_9BURK